ncbi:MAG: hypothetical protein ABI562_00100 [Chloroflexota bacterium]
MHQLHNVEPVRSASTAFRLNLLVPTVEGARTFGGIRTALDVFEAIGDGVPERRIIAAKGAALGSGESFGPYAAVSPGEDPAAALQFVALERPGTTLAVRPDDVFVATFWTTAELVARLRRWQASTYGRAPGSFGYLIQDYEPAFYPASAQSELARATYADAEGTIGVFNTALLRDHFHASGIRFAREFVFEPQILPELRRAMAEPPLQRTRTIVAYGRPGTPRNAFAAIVDGLRAWQASQPDADSWTLVSVGQTHADVDLGGGSVLRSIGKLDLAGYATLLRGSAIGISLMISPHPSYPPLEMAHLGMLVLSNRYGAKDLSAWHSNILSTDDLSAEGIAARLAELCRRFETDPETGATGRPLRPEFTSEGPLFPFASELAAALGAPRGSSRRSPG